MPSGHEAMRSSVESYVRLNLRDPEFSIDQIAKRFGCSKRYLHNLFIGSGTTLAQFVRNERLSKCCGDLEQSDNAKRSITEIAFSWGFNNSAHFSKTFKARYGIPPKQWRLQS